MTGISHLTYELSILAKAIEYKNLSSAANFVGLSQPQLSRLVQKLEGELKVVLLDRASRRKSGWTQEAEDLVNAFRRGMSRLEAEVLAVTTDRDLDELRIGTLEGLSGIALSYVSQFFEKLKIKQIDLDVLEYKDLDNYFLNGQLDLIFTVRLPSKQKFKYSLEVGYQQMERIQTNSDLLVVSPFELVQTHQNDPADFENVFVSNSLALRSRWLKEYGGTGTLPVDAKRGKGKGFYSVYMIGNDLLSLKLWEQIQDLSV